ncbi:MAG TPA: hypothetical protein PLH94_04005 [Fimbriimonadaceae bacterium]|nr:hypothetical protein [Fimbriimonadaceae bacterium]
MRKIDTTQMTRVDPTSDFDPRIGVAAERASRFLAAHDWCQDILGVWYARSMQSLDVLYVQFRSDEAETDHAWVVVGDVPPAYLDADDIKNAIQALHGYADEVQRWCDKVLGTDYEDPVMPLRDPASWELLPETEENARRLEVLVGRIVDFIAENAEDLV